MNIIKFRNIAYIISGALVIASIFLFITRGLNYGIDFRGGKNITIQLTEEAFRENEEIRDDTVLLNNLRNALDAIGIVNIQQYDQVSLHQYLIKIPETFDEHLKSLSADELQQYGVSVSRETNMSITQQQQQAWEDVTLTSRVIIGVLEHTFGKGSIVILSEQSVGATIGVLLQKRALKLIIFALAAIILYITIRFKFRYGVSAVIALLHDVIIVLGVFSFLQKEITIPIIAAVLTIIGYSLNDTIVVFDRIRETISVHRSEKIETVVNTAILNTLSRTLITSLTTFVAVLMLYLFGGIVINDFAFAIGIGIIVGTYSSIFVASPVLIEWHTLFPSNKKS